MGMGMRPGRLIAVFAALTVVGACQPTVKIEPPDKPIVINLNIKIEHEIRVKVERSVDDLLATEKGLF
jgi:hypothetical protein